MRYPRLIFSLLTLLCLSHLTQAQPSLDIDRSAGPARVWLDGEVGRDYTVESSSDDMSSNGWEFEFTLTLTNPPQSWFDSASVLMPKRFYRAVDLEGPAPVEIANDFRLTDHQGKSRSLYYYGEDTNVQAMVLIFTGNGCPDVHRMVSTIKALRDQFAPQGVLFWMIDANAGDDRSNIVAEATAAGIDLPILHDRAQIVARAYQASAAPEAICVSRADWSIFYRGSIDDRVGSNTVATTQTYLASALADFLAHGTVTLKQTRTAGCDITFNPQPLISYSTDIAPLLLNKCVRCHSAGNIAPFAMSNYTKVRGFSAQIKEEVLTGRMPPWHADPYYGTFANDFSLSPDEAAKLIQWIDEGSPRGTGPDPLATTSPPPTNYPFAWPAALGPPTKIITLQNQSIPATGVIDYRYMQAASPFTSNVWIGAAVILPGNVKVVHHVLALNGVDNAINSFFVGYVPGYDAVAFPPGTGKLLKTNDTLTFQMHYITMGQATNDQTRLGLYALPAPPTYPLVQTSAANTGFVIPPGHADLETTAQKTMSSAIYLYELSPHQHFRGSRFKYEAIYPAGHVPARETLLSVPSYKFNWQALYRFTAPKYLPAGTTIRCTGAWDNSANNPANPDPTSQVRWGEQTFEEMFIGYFNYRVAP